MRSFIVTSTQARKLPRWGLLLLCALYVIPGLLGRDPWRVDDAAGFGVAYTMYAGSLIDWLVPNVVGEPLPGQGPLPFALAAGFARLMDWPAPYLEALIPGLEITPHLSVRIAAAIGLFAMLAAIWRAIYLLSRRPGITPTDPLGAGAKPTDLARAIADSGLLITIATFGLLARMHETTAIAAQATFVALFILGLAISLDSARRGAIIAALAIGASMATRGLPVAAPMLITWMLLLWLSQPFTLVRSSALKIGLPLAIVSSLAWPALLIAHGSAEALVFLTEWIYWNLSAIGWPDADSLTFAGRYAPWFFWPAWPLAAWAIYRWAGRFDQPAVALPALLAATLLLVTLGAREPGEAWLLPAALPVAALAAIGLPTLSRAVVNLIDWFAVMFFSLFGFAIWAYWLALLTGWPPRMANSARALTPGYLARWSELDLFLALAASTAWLLLVRWRISRQPPVIWRAVVLSSGGLCLAWFLLMTLWLPVFNERNTYRSVADQIATYIPRDGSCVETRHLGPAERATLSYFAGLEFGTGTRPCRFLLIQDHGNAALVQPAEEAGWRFIWSGRRRPGANDRLRLYGLISGSGNFRK